MEAPRPNPAPSRLPANGEAEASHRSDLDERLRQSEGLQRHLAEGIYALSLVRGPEEAYQVLMDRAATILPVPHWCIGKVLERAEGPRVELAGWTSSLWSRFGGVLRGLSIPVSDGAFAREVYGYRQMSFVAETGAEPGRVEPGLVAAFGIRSLLGLPLVFEGQVGGVLYAVALEGEASLSPSEDQLSVLQSLARIAALALERLRAQAALEESASLAQDLAQGVRDLAEAHDEATLVAALFHWAGRIAPVPNWWLNRFDPVSRTSTTLHWTPGLEAFGSPEAIREPVPVRAGSLMEALHFGHQSLNLPRCEGHAEIPDLGAWPYRTLLGVPLAHQGEIVGTLFGGSFGEQGHVIVSDKRFEALESLAGAAGLVLNRLKARGDLEAEEARFRQLFEQAPDAHLLLRDGRFVAVNAAAVRLFGLSREQLMGRAPWELSPEFQPSGERSRDAAQRLIEGAVQGPSQRFEWHHLGSDGHEFPCEVSLTLMSREEGPIVQAIVRDIGAQKRAEADRTALERQLFQAQKMESLGVLAGGIAHDFNNLLMGVLGHAGLALEQLNPLHPARRNLEAIQKAGQRAADLTRQMLAYSGRGQFVVRNLDLTMQVEEMVHLLEVSLPKTVVLKLDLRRGLPAISADAAQIQQVIMNLVINAAEAIGETSGLITLATGAQHLDAAMIRALLVGQDVAPGTYVYLEVSDTGCGMDPETIGRIFEPFFTTKFTGRGLGLSAIMGIVRGHKGALKVYSEVGRGTTFKVLFPSQGAAQEPASPGPGDVAWRGAGLVLVVDDDETVRSVARQTLELKGFEVLEAEDGLVALELLQRRGTDIALVLLDMTMPHLGGEATFREMRQRQPEIRVILSSGYNEQEAMSRFMGKGLKGFLQKPYGPRELLAKVQSVLGG
ncbi:MAG TPA: response regulator [Holophagaceae bacterium]